MAKMPPRAQEEQPQGESPFPPEPGESGWQNPRSDRPQITFSLPPLGPIVAVVGIVALTVVAVLVVQKLTEEAPPGTPDPTLVALQSQATQLAVVEQTQTAAAQIPTATVTAQVVVTATPEPQVVVVTAPLEPQVVVVTATPLAPTAPPAVRPSPTIAARPTSSQPPPAAANCGSRNGDDINVGRNAGGPCGSMPLRDFLAIMNADLGPMPKPYYDKLDSAFNNSGGDIGYQYRASIPAYIPASSAPATRVMWGDLGWLGQLSDSARQQAEDRILRLRCENQYGVCIYLLTDADGLEIDAQGRGVLLSEPLNPEEDLPWWSE